MSRENSVVVLASGRRPASHRAQAVRLAHIEAHRTAIGVSIFGEKSADTNNPLLVLTVHRSVVQSSPAAGNSQHPAGRPSHGRGPISRSSSQISSCSGSMPFGNGLGHTRQEKPRPCLGLPARPSSPFSTSRFEYPHNPTKYQDIFVHNILLCLFISAAGGVEPKPTWQVHLISTPKIRGVLGLLDGRVRCSG